jgi:hypothetical protein
MAVLPKHQEMDLAMVDDHLARVYRRAFQKLGGKCRFDGARSVEESAANIKAGRSKLKNPYNSKHVIGPKRPKAEAIDVYPTAPGLALDDPHSYDHVRSAMKEAALEEGVSLFNGGEKWGWDWPHWELIT